MGSQFPDPMDSEKLYSPSQGEEEPHTYHRVQGAGIREPLSLCGLGTWPATWPAAQSAMRTTKETHLEKK